MSGPHTAHREFVQKHPLFEKYRRECTCSAKGEWKDTPEECETPFRWKDPSNPINANDNYEHCALPSEDTNVFPDLAVRETTEHGTVDPEALKHFESIKDGTAHPDVLKHIEEAGTFESKPEKPQ